VLLLHFSQPPPDVAELNFPAGQRPTTERPDSALTVTNEPGSICSQKVEALVAAYLPMGQPEQGSKSKVGLNFPAGQAAKLFVATFAR
jgi:hypothetical protein